MSIEDIRAAAHKLAADVAALPIDEQVQALNEVRRALHDVGPFQDEPVDLVLWVSAEKVCSNAYNPNRVGNPEMELLRHSIRSDGYTQPIVGFSGSGGYEVVDGFHRNRVGKEDPDVRARVHGFLPVVSINDGRKDLPDRMASTVRHNRARGKHQVTGMSEIVVALSRRNWSNEKIGKELGMDADEVLRLRQISGLAEMFADRDFSMAWEVAAEDSE